MSIAVVGAAVALLGTPFWLLSRSTATVSDTETLGPNRLAAATLDIEAGARSTTFVIENMAAGDHGYGFIEIRNTGDLPLAAEVISRSDGGRLDDQLSLTIWPSARPCTTTTTGPNATTRTGLGGPSGSTLVGDPAPGVQPNAVTLQPGQSSSWCLEVSLALEAGNEVQGLSATQEIVAEAVHLVDPDELDPLLPTTST
ncbi:MAG: hypothetical protein ACR2QE_04165 [Acidimicrobiales bacterium]